MLSPLPLVLPCDLGRCGVIPATYGGLPVIVSPALPIAPSPGEQARRIVRHGYADVLAWLDEEVGPEPDELTHVMLSFDPARPGSGVAFVSAEMAERLKAQAAVA